jgi:hypothetical protein
MNPTVRPLLAAATLLVLGVAPALAQPSIRVAIVSDVSDEGQSAPVPAAGKPVYYYAVTPGYVISGPPLAGETSPRTAYVQHLLAKALAAHGYLYQATGKTPPPIVLLLQWGYMTPALNDDLTMANEQEMQTLVMGTSKLEENKFSSSVSSLYDAARLPRYYVTVTALDFAAFVQKRRAELWCTRASTELEANHLAAVLPTLIASAAPLFGTQTSRPQLVDTPLVPTMGASPAAPAR